MLLMTKEFYTSEYIIIHYFHIYVEYNIILVLCIIKTVQKKNYNKQAITS